MQFGVMCRVKDDMQHSRVTQIQIKIAQSFILEDNLLLREKISPKRMKNDKQSGM